LICSTLENNLLTQYLTVARRQVNADGGIYQREVYGPGVEYRVAILFKTTHPSGELIYREARTREWFYRNHMGGLYDGNPLRSGTALLKGAGTHGRDLRVTMAVFAPQHIFWQHGDELVSGNPIFEAASNWIEEQPYLQPIPPVKDVGGSLVTQEFPADCRYFYRVVEYASPPDLNSDGVPDAFEVFRYPNPDDNHPIITEICYCNEVTGQPNYPYDWIELYNPSLHPIDLGKFSISDSTGNPGKHRFRTLDGILPPASFALLHCRQTNPLGYRELPLGAPCY
jgi:hypothetical protein